MEEEVRREVEQAKELQDATAAHIAHSSGDEQWIRQCTLVLDSSMRRLRDSIGSQASSGLLNSKLVDKIEAPKGKNWAEDRRTRLKDIISSLTTSKELLKVIFRVGGLEKQHKPTIALVQWESISLRRGNSKGANLHEGSRTHDNLNGFDAGRLLKFFSQAKTDSNKEDETRRNRARTGLKDHQLLNFASPIRPWSHQSLPLQDRGMESWTGGTSNEWEIKASRD